MESLDPGGLTAHDWKYKNPRPQEIRCPMFITCQTEMDFGEEHNPAMDARLRKFYFKSLNTPPVSVVQQSLRETAMDCIVWASRVARTPDDGLSPPMSGSAAKANEFDEKEKNRIKTMDLDDSESDQEAQIEQGQLVAADDDVSGEDDGQENSDIESTCSDGWEKRLEKIFELQDQQPYNSLRQRQLGLIEVGMKRATKEPENNARQAKERILAKTR